MCEQVRLVRRRRQHRRPHVTRPAPPPPRDVSVTRPTTLTPISCPAQVLRLGARSCPRVAGGVPVSARPVRRDEPRPTLLQRQGRDVHLLPRERAWGSAGVGHTGARRRGRGDLLARNDA